MKNYCSMLQKHLIAFLALISINSYAQNWNLKSPSSSLNYPFEYWFQFEETQDESKCNARYQTSNDSSFIQVYSKNGEALELVMILIRKLDSDSTVGLLSDENGKAYVNLEKGEYSIEARAPGFIKHQVEFKIQANQSFLLCFKLAKARDENVYQINSKQELSENEMTEIEDCIREHGTGSINDCSKLKTYFILIHI